MADLYQSSLFEPTAPPESLLHKSITKKPPKIVSRQDANVEEKTPATKTPSRPRHTLTPFLDYFTKRRKINNNNNNNNNNNKFNHEHSSKATETHGDTPHSKTENGGKKFRFFRGKQTSEPSPVKESTKATTGSEKEKATLSQYSEVDVKQPESLEPPARNEMEVLCHGLMKTESLGQECLLSHSAHETYPESEVEVQKSANQELGVLMVDVGKNDCQPRSDENVAALKYEKFVDMSEMQEQLNSINLKRSMDATMPQSLCSTITLPAHSESLSIPPVIEEIEESSVEEPPVIEVFLPQRELPSKQSSGIELVQGLDANLVTHNNVKKRRKLRHILRHFLSMNNSLAKEDKQRLVENEEEDDEDEEPATIETAIDELEGQGDKYSISESPPTQDNPDAGAPEKKRQPGTKGPCRGWGRRVRRSLGRGCHYLGLSVLNITNYIIAEATFMGHVYPNRNYDWDYIYSTDEYRIRDYTY